MLFQMQAQPPQSLQSTDRLMDRLTDRPRLGLRRRAGRFGIVLALWLALASAGAPLIANAAPARPTPTPVAPVNETTPSVTARSAPILLFQSDFSTHGERWRLCCDSTDAAVQYVENGLSLDITPANYAIWSYPDTDLRPGSADLTMTIGWQAGADDAVFGLIVQYRSDNDMTIATLSRAGTLRYGNYLKGVFTDAADPVQVTLDRAADSVSLRAVLQHGKPAADKSVTDSLDLYVNGTQSLKVSFPAGRSGRFGVFARSGSEPGLNFILRGFTVSIPQ